MKVKEYQGFTITQAGHSWYWWNNQMKGVKGPFITEGDAVIDAMQVTRQISVVSMNDPEAMLNAIYDAVGD